MFAFRQIFRIQFQIYCSNISQLEVRLAKTEGKEVLIFLMLVAMEGVGLLKEFVVILNLGLSSAFSSALIRTHSLGGFS